MWSFRDWVETEFGYEYLWEAIQNGSESISFCLRFRRWGDMFMRDKDIVRVISEGIAMGFWTSLSALNRFHDIWLIKSNMGKANHCKDSMENEKS
jgi:hypothetical protein